jgi:hypothetical protein
MLQYLLQKDFWKIGSNANWIKSISGISPVFNGSTLPYFLGCDPTTGLLNGTVGNSLARILEIIAGAVGAKFEHLYDFDLEHWPDIAERQPSETVMDYLNRVGESKLFKGEDNAAYDLTLQALRDQNSKIETYPNTFYFSYVTEQTTQLLFSSHHVPDLGMNPMLAGFAFYMGTHPFADGSFGYNEFKSADWRENDGAVPSFSQMYPRIAGNHPVGGPISNQRENFQPSRWYWEFLHDRDHLDVVMLPELDQIAWQRAFYSRLFERLANLPSSPVKST